MFLDTTSSVYSYSAATFLVVSFLVLLIIAIILVVAMWRHGSGRQLNAPTIISLMVDGNTGATGTIGVNGQYILTWNKPTNALLGQQVTYNVTTNINGTSQSYVNLISPVLPLTYNGQPFTTTTTADGNNYSVSAAIIAMSSGWKDSPTATFHTSVPNGPLTNRPRAPINAATENRPNVFNTAIVGNAAVIPINVPVNAINMPIIPAATMIHRH